MSGGMGSASTSPSVLHFPADPVTNRPPSRPGRPDPWGPHGDPGTHRSGSTSRALATARSSPADRIHGTSWRPSAWPATRDTRGLQASAGSCISPDPDRARPDIEGAGGRSF